jgi:hypothetical protein
MKKLFASVGLFFMTISISSATTVPVPSTAPKSFQVGMYNVKNSHLLKVFVEKAKGQSLKIELKDKEGITLLTEFVNKKVTKTGFSFDLGSLRPDHYSLSVSNDSEVLIKQLDVTSSTIENKKIVL